MAPDAKNPKAASQKRQFFTAQDIKNLRWFWSNYLKARAPWLLVVMVLIMAQAFVYQQFLRLTEDGLRVIFEDGAVSDLIRVCITVFLLFSARGAMSYIVPRLSTWLASEAVQKMREDLIKHLLTLDLEFFERTSAGEIILRLVNQADGLSQFVGQKTVNAVRDLTTVIVVSGYLVYRSPQLFLTAVIVLPAIVFIITRVSARVKEVQAEAENVMGDYMSGIEEMSNGMRTVKISGQEGQEQKRLFEATSGIKAISIKLQAAQALVLPAMDLVSAFVYVLVIGGGGYMVLSPNYDMDGAAIIAFLLGMVLVFDPLRLFAQFIARLQANLIILDAITGVYREQPTIKDAPGALTSFDTSGDIIFDDITFRYSSDVPLFENLSLTFKGGSVTALVGATGSGKTTVLSLLTRLYKKQDGDITIGGTSIEDIRIADLRGAFSVVAQDIVIFNASMFDNIRYVRPDATDEEVWAAAEAAEIADLMRQRGDVPLGTKGSQLSGGQKQRIAIARAFLRDAPILLLDEATSALDQRTEDKVKRALARLSVERTTLIVAHRLSAITHADTIFVMDEGRLVEQGDHQSLLSQGGLYAGLYEAQKQGYQTTTTQS